MPFSCTCIYNLKGGGGVVQPAMHVRNKLRVHVRVAGKNQHHIFVEAWHKWKNHLHEMKGDVGMSVMKKKGNKKMHTPRHR